MDFNNNHNNGLRQTNRYNPYPQTSPMADLNYLPNITVENSCDNSNNTNVLYKSPNLNNSFSSFSNNSNSTVLNSNLFLNSNNNTNTNNVNLNNLTKLSTSYILSTLAAQQNTNNNNNNNNGLIPSSPTSSNTLLSPLSPSLSPSFPTNTTTISNSQNHINFSLSSTPSTPTTTPPSYLMSNDSDSIDDDYDFLKEGWKKIKDLSSELAKLSKLAVKHDLQSVDMVPNLQKEYENFGIVLKSMSDKYNFMKSDDRQQKKRKESDKNAEKRKKRREATLLLNNVCKACKTTDTPEWRKGPDGTKSLCNACGLHFAKIIKKEASLALPQFTVESKESMKLNSILN